MTERLTEEQLAEIRADVEGSWRHDPKYDADDMLALLGEVEALRAERDEWKHEAVHQANMHNAFAARAEAAEAERDAVVQAIWSMHSMIVHELDSDPMDDPMDYVAVDGAEATAAACRAIADGRERYMESNEHTAWINR